MTRHRSRYAPDEQVERAVRLALKHGVALVLSSDGSVKILGKLDSPPSAELPSNGGDDDAEAYDQWKQGRTALPGANKIWRTLPEGRVARGVVRVSGRGAPMIARFEGATRGAVIAQENSVEGAKRIADGYASAAHPKIDTGTLGGILDAWEASDAFKRRAESTKRSERNVLKHIRAAEIVKTPARFLNAKAFKAVRRDLRKWLGEIAETNGPRAADTRCEIISKACNWGITEDLCEANPAEGIDDFSYSDRSDIIWLGPDLAAFEAKGREARRKVMKKDAPEPEEPPETTLALLLACYSGLRREDLVRFADPHVGPSAIMLKPLKAQRRARTAGKKAPADIIIPRTPELDAVIAMCLKVRAKWEKADEVKRSRILLNSRGKPWTPAGLTSSFIKIRDEADIKHVYDDGRAPEPKTLHDGRGTFVTHMRCLGYTKEEVAEMVGWETDDVDRVARKYADANRIAQAWLERLKRERWMSRRNVIIGVLEHELKRQLSESIEGQFTMARDLDWGEIADALGIGLGYCTVRVDFKGEPQTITWNDG